jgi:hypothetical protein
VKVYVYRLAAVAARGPTTNSVLDIVNNVSSCDCEKFPRDLIQASRLRNQARCWQVADSMRAEAVGRERTLDGSLAPAHHRCWRGLDVLRVQESGYRSEAAVDGGTVAGVR